MCQERHKSLIARYSSGGDGNGPAEEKKDQDNDIRRRRAVLVRPWLSAERRLHFGDWDQLMNELRIEDEHSFFNYVRIEPALFDEMLQRSKDQPLMRDRSRPIGCNLPSICPRRNNQHDRCPNSEPFDSGRNCKVQRLIRLYKRQQRYGRRRKLGNYGYRKNRA
ncbi:unnamed protein product [Mytilus coruscus]|uniref:Uncharacterized protein n=1 Tax=Mytilus coruscus TaxID=42192 RepID=A0A6J8BTR4_MYTCO|nr:unnamed protein product [Mytilus coruscus]